MREQTGKARWAFHRWSLVVLLAVVIFLLLGFVVGAVLAEGAIHPILKRRASDTAALAYSIAEATHARATKVNMRAADGTLLDAWWLVPPDAGERGMVVCHGVADSAYGALGYALLFLRHGYSVLVPESRGHGESGGINTYGVLESGDTIDWLHWMQAQRVQDIFGFGESLGGSILIQSLAQGAPFRAVVAECPYSSFTSVATERVGRVLPRPIAFALVKEGIFYVRLRYGLNLAKAEPVSAIGHAHVPILLIHGLSDNETSPEHTRILASANRKFAQAWFIPGAKHTGAYAKDPKLFEDRVLQWLSRTGPN